jgi:hypothetical protein
MPFYEKGDVRIHYAVAPDDQVQTVIGQQVTRRRATPSWLIASCRHHARRHGRRHPRHARHLLY